LRRDPISKPLKDCHETPPIFAAAAVILSLLSGNSFAQSDKAAKQAEVLKATQASLEKFYKEDPALKAAVAKAPGYAVFSTAGISFLVGGAGGKGVAHDNKTKKNTFMSMAQASAGVQIGLSGSETLIIFNTAQGLADFIAKGWVGGIGGSIQAGANGRFSWCGGGSDELCADLHPDQERRQGRHCRRGKQVLER
jgi:lipid-binding SYLF domain-containing protein